MNLFTKEKGMILSILNAILVLWLVAAIMFVVSSTTSMILKHPFYTYEEYKSINCDMNYETESSCKRYYNDYTFSLKNDEVYETRSLIVALSNVVIVSVVLVILNIKKTQNK